MDYQGFVPPFFGGGYATKFALHKALKSIASGNLTFDEKGVVHRVRNVLLREGGVSWSAGSWRSAGECIFTVGPSPQTLRDALEPFSRVLQYRFWGEGQFGGTSTTNPHGLLKSTIFDLLSQPL